MGEFSEYSNDREAREIKPYAESFRIRGTNMRSSVYTLRISPREQVGEVLKTGLEKVAKAGKYWKTDTFVEMNRVMEPGDTMNCERMHVRRTRRSK